MVNDTLVLDLSYSTNSQPVSIEGCEVDYSVLQQFCETDQYMFGTMVSIFTIINLCLLGFYLFSPVYRGRFTIYPNLIRDLLYYYAASMVLIWGRIYLL